ncbi:hypothetical protein [Williamsia herbipolensis]|uniref:hypothetical protein n=1 Tax=Williamsia herbipolensis TaxID=1603258 RepID=UPI0005F8583B|nr:hypothetical protein [Williamsia herbipolensis]
MIIDRPTVDPHRPVHVVFAAPWQSIDRHGPGRTTDETWWTFPDDVADGDTVVTVVQGREAAVLGVSVLRMGTDPDDWDLEPADPIVSEPLSAAAISRRAGTAVTVDPRSLHHTEGAAVIAAIEGECDAPTPWFALPSPCADVDTMGVSAVESSWGCTGCGRRWAGKTSPRLQRHKTVEVPYDDIGWVALCPSCHDIVHQPLGPSVDELMFGNRPACPACNEHRTFRVLWGMPASPPPYGTVGAGCVVMGDTPTRRCGACGHEW